MDWITKCLVIESLWIVQACSAMTCFSRHAGTGPIRDMA